MPFIYLFFASFSRAAKSSILWLLRIFKKTCFKFHFMCTLNGKVKLLLKSFDRYPVVWSESILSC